jgi:AcrR family transcriptional regulator
VQQSREDSKHTQDQDRRPKRHIRADAQRNEDALLEAAKAVFATTGVDAPVREIAAKAGVGLGTLYRRFPTRADLIAAVFRREVDACTAEAEALAAEYLPGEALSRWLKRYTELYRNQERPRRGAAFWRSGIRDVACLFPGQFRASTCIASCCGGRGRSGSNGCRPLRPFARNWQPVDRI